MSVPKFDVEEMAKLLNQRKNGDGPAIVLFLGSRTGSLFRHSFLAELLRGFSYQDLLNMTSIERFRKCHQILEDFKKERLDRDIHLIIRRALQEYNLEVAAICVAELMRQRLFDFIITTNIGSELELAFRQSDLKEPHDFEVIIPGLGEPISEMTNDHTFKIIKASGDFEANRYTVSNTENYIEKYPYLKRMFEQVKGADMLVVGLDPTWDKHAIDAIFPRTAGNLWYVNEAKTLEDDYPIFTHLQACNAKRLEGPIGGYETFFMNLCRHVLGSVPIYQVTLNKLISMERMLHDLQEDQINLQQQLSKLESRKQSPQKEGPQQQQQNQPPTIPFINVFYTYSEYSADEELRERIEIQLEALRQTEIISAWYNGKPVAGTEREIEIKKQWDDSKIILLLVSTAFISSSNYNFAKKAMERHKAKSAWVIPIVLSPVDLKRTVFSELQVLPDNGQPITAWPNRDEALLNVAKGIYKVIEQLTKPKE